MGGVDDGAGRFVEFAKRRGHDRDDALFAHAFAHAAVTSVDAHASW